MMDQPTIVGQFPKPFYLINKLTLLPYKQAKGSRLSLKWVLISQCAKPNKPDQTKPCVPINRDRHLDNLVVHIQLTAKTRK